MKRSSDLPYYHDNLLIGNRLNVGAIPMVDLRAYSEKDISTVFRECLQVRNIFLSYQDYDKPKELIFKNIDKTEFKTFLDKMNIKNINKIIDKF